MTSKVHVKCDKCLEKNLERTETEEGHAWVCPRFKRYGIRSRIVPKLLCFWRFLTTALCARSERGKGCGVIITEERYAEMKEEIEEELRAEEAAKRRAEKVPHRSPALANIQTVLYLTVVA